MTRYVFLSIFICILFAYGQLSGSEAVGIWSETSLLQKQDSVDKQVLYNGRVWRNLYSKVIEDQFLFTKEFLPGNVTIDGRSFSNIPIRYDIYNDEIMTISDRQLILQLNKEMTDIFTLKYNGKDYHFRRLDPDSLNSLTGYVNVLYDGNSSLYIKYRKEILLLEVDHKYDKFNELDKVYLEKDGKISLIRSKMDFLKTLKDHKLQIRSFIKSNRLVISKADPWTFIPVIEFYDQIRQKNDEDEK